MFFLNYLCKRNQFFFKQTVYITYLVPSAMSSIFHTTVTFFQKRARDHAVFSGSEFPEIPGQDTGCGRNI